MFSLWIKQWGNKLVLAQTHTVTVKVTIFLGLSLEGEYFFAIFFYDASFGRNELGQKARQNVTNIHRPLYMHVYLDLYNNLIFLQTTYLSK
jgi:hypothetical protein